MLQPIYLSPKQSKQPPAQIQNSKKSRLRIKSQNHFLALSHFIFAVNLTTMEEPNSDQENQLSHKIAAILDEVRTSYATHNRKLKELSLLRSKSSSPSEFFSAFSKSLIPLFNFQRRLASADRVVSFVSSFTAARNPADAEVCDEFLDHFLHFLLVAATAADKTVRFRACQIISEIILRLPDDAEVSNDLWDEVIECMKVRVRDKIHVVRTFAVRALSRFVNDSSNIDILDLFLEMLPLEQNAVSVAI